MQQDVLNVFLNESQVGTLLQENGALSFKYAPEYLQNKEAYPLSQNLPLTDGIFHDPVVENFFSNLLPDERIRTTVAMILRVSPENTFGLLKHIGADCAGAVSFYPGDRGKPHAGTGAGIPDRGQQDRRDCGVELRPASDRTARFAGKGF